MATLSESLLSTVGSELITPDLQQIERYDLMEPMLMTLASDTDLWMYVSSSGALTAGRIDADHSALPYCTEDVLHRSSGVTGPATIFRVRDQRGGFKVWRPFRDSIAGDGVSRSLYKSVIGDRIVFEERNDDLGLVFRYRWAACDEFGFVRTAELANETGSPATVDVLDGVLNLVAAGLGSSILQSMSVLTDAYTECSVDSDCGLCTISLASLPVDKPEPRESFHATVAWSHGLEHHRTLVSEDQIRAFLSGSEPHGESFMRGRRSNFLVLGQVELDARQARSWNVVVDAYRSQPHVEELRAFLLSKLDHRERLEQSLAAGSARLRGYIEAADGTCCTEDLQGDRHHSSCALFNVMRGGIYANGYTIPSEDFRAFVQTRNAKVAANRRVWLTGLPEDLSLPELIEGASETGDSQLLRLAYEYLPLTFSRRHGDPSRPWNRFSIRLKNPDGSPLLAYEGNWRDIFQNWEALSLSFPNYLPSLIAKFVNASTIDGFNPGRISREGVDWETPSSSEWSAFGYWGDHQIVYLLKFLEFAERTSPEALNGLLGRRLFSYANVPYRLKSYEEMVCHPTDTIAFDFELNHQIEAQVPQAGSDSRLVKDSSGDVYLASLTEKLIVPALSKLSNLVLDGGIWMNTQCPEWNDANNALVGNGVSMVTLCYLRRYLTFMASVVSSDGRTYPISHEVAQWLRAVSETLDRRKGVLLQEVSDSRGRRELLDELGGAFARYRTKVYAEGFSGQEPVSGDEMVRLCTLALPYLDHSIRSSRRADGLYHAYYVVDLRDPGAADLSPLFEMLEGQVAVLSAGVLDALEARELIEALFNSNIYCPERRTFMLYPDRMLPRFLEKNVIEAKTAEADPLFAELLKASDRRLVLRDAGGRYRFAPDLINASEVARVLDRLEQEPRWAELAKENRQAVLDCYESVFRHRFFTGRSRSMYGYEGLGCVYWHMVSKLLVAIAETFIRAADSGAPPCELQALAQGYYRVRDGMGFNKSPQEFGAFPSDPYSHTPSGRGAKQPGMTGQTKEDILARWMELGVRQHDGCLEFRPIMLRPQWFLKDARTWQVHGTCLELGPNSLGFTVCGVPVIYRLGGTAKSLRVVFDEGSEEKLAGSRLTRELSEHVFGRTGRITRIEVELTRADVL